MYESIGNAEVLGNEDPQGRNRVLVKPIGVAGGLERWARVATPYGGSGYGINFLPEVGDEVLVAFSKGAEPVVLGALFQAGDALPNASPEVKCLRSKGGHEVSFSEGALTVKTAGGHELLLSDEEGDVELKNANGDVVRMKAGGIEIVSSSKVTVSGSVVEVSGSMVTIDAAMVDCSGVVKCDSLVTNSVVSASYTPGAGNVW